MGHHGVTGVDAGGKVGAVQLIQGVDDVAQILPVGAVVGRPALGCPIVEEQIFNAHSYAGVFQCRNQSAKVIQRGLPGQFLVLPIAEIHVQNRVSHDVGTFHIGGGVNGTASLFPEPGIIFRVADGHRRIGGVALIHLQTAVPDGLTDALKMFCKSRVGTVPEEAVLPVHGILGDGIVDGIKTCLTEHFQPLFHTVGLDHTECGSGNFHCCTSCCFLAQSAE